MKVGSLCAGIGGLDLGLHSHGHDTAWVCEYEEAPAQVLTERFGVPNYGDITVMDWGNVEPVDVIAAGYPCQPFSTAGLRKGEDDERNIWPAVARAIGDLRPRYVFLENVRAHLSMGFDRVLGDLADLGFDAEWAVLRASDVGAPHRRERIFILAADPLRVNERELTGEPPGEQGEGRHQPDDYEPRRAGQGELPTTVAADTEGDGRGTGRSSDSPWDAERGDATGGSRERMGEYEPAVAHWESIRGTAPAGLDRTEPPRLNAAFVEWMMGYPAGWVTDILPRSQALRALGNAVVPGVAALAWGHLTDRVHEDFE